MLYACCADFGKEARTKRWLGLVVRVRVIFLDLASSVGAMRLRCVLLFCATLPLGVSSQDRACRL